MEPKTLLMMSVGGIISENVSYKDPSISFLERLDLSMRYGILPYYYIKNTFFLVSCLHVKAIIFYI